jgi:hypothetical protein
MCLHIFRCPERRKGVFISYLSCDGFQPCRRKTIMLCFAVVVLSLATHIISESQLSLLIAPSKATYSTILLLVRNKINLDLVDVMRRSTSHDVEDRLRNSCAEALSGRPRRRPRVVSLLATLRNSKLLAFSGYRLLRPSPICHKFENHPLFAILNSDCRGCRGQASADTHRLRECSARAISQRASIMAAEQRAMPQTGPA